MATFVLIPGGWSGGWQWRSVVRLLQADGHEVFAVTLTGLGERWHLASPEIRLVTHVEDVANVLRFEQLDDVILVGHSYGGMVITGVAEQEPERLAHLVYVDAFIPEDGQSLFDLLGPDVRQHFENVAREQGDGWCIPYDPPDGPETHRRTPLPIRVLEEPLSIRHPQASTVPRTYIACTDTLADLGDLGRPLVEAARRTRADPRWGYRELATGHVPMETMTVELTDLLREVAEGRG
jgi:pimeloyl-ACP methyl ester carboxylesterase